MRHFRHLTEKEIREIVVAHHGGEKRASIAQRFGIDPSTVTHHVKKFDEAYPEQTGIYAIAKVNFSKVCMHPSAKCTLCGMMADLLRRVELDEIERLRSKLRQAHDTLRSAGYAVE